MPALSWVILAIIIFYTNDYRSLIKEPSNKGVFRLYPGPLINLPGLWYCC